MGNSSLSVIKGFTGAMTFRDLLWRYSFEKIKPAFIGLWWSNAPERAKLLDLNKWEKIYQRIQSLKSEVSDYYIYLHVRWEGCSSMVDMNCAVYSKESGRHEGPMSCYPSWTEVVGMEVVVGENVEIAPQELTAGLFWEITYFGGTEALATANREIIFSK